LASSFLNKEACPLGMCFKKMLRPYGTIVTAARFAGSSLICIEGFQYIQKFLI